MKYRLFNRKTKEYDGEAVDIGGTLHVHYFSSRGSYSYSFGEWPSMKKYRYDMVEKEEE